MKKIICVLAVTALFGTLSVSAQPPGGGRQGGGEPRGGGPQGGGPPGQHGGQGGGNNAVLAAIDADGDHVISAAEIMNAAAALKSLDRNNDGQLTSEEVHAGEGRPDQRGGREGERGGREGQRGGREAQAGGPPPQGGHGGPGGPPPQGGHGGPGGPPTAEKFMEHAMTFDTDKDGTLNQAELKKMSEAVVKEMSQNGPPGGHGGPGGGDARQGGGRPGGGGGGGNRQRPDIE